ncbi:MAG: DUF86 domain-containing protein [Anaerolineae bacterium]|nr:DUF86 domain-containing protein [Anaerolineae bacterium]
MHNPFLYLPESSRQKVEPNNLAEHLRAALASILRACPAVRLAYLHGSAAEGATTPLSDVDIALVTTDALGLSDAFEIELEVQYQLRECTGINNADVRIINPASLIFKGQVVTRGVLVYSADDAFRIAFETHTRLAYLDFKPIEERVLEALFPTTNGGNVIDRHKILRMFQQQREYLKHLRALAQMDVEKFVADAMSTAAAKYYCLVAIEICIDVGNHIIAGKQFRAPTDYADVFRILGENQVIPKEFARTLGKMAGFRNLLVHNYLEVDDRLVHENLRTRLSDFEQFQNYILQFLER